MKAGALPLRVTRPTPGVIRRAGPVAALGLAWLLGREIGASGAGLKARLVVLLIGGLVAIAVGLRPHLGLYALVGALSLRSVLPTVPFFTGTLFPLLGLITAGAYVLQRAALRHSPREGRAWDSAYLAAAALPVWILASRPDAALSGPGGPGNWALTYAQLAALLWVTSRLLDRPARHHQLIWVFAVGAALSGAVAIREAGIAATFEESARGRGLTGGTNLTALYATVAFLLFDHLRAVAASRRARLLAVVGAVVAVVGVAATLSRTGFLVGAAAVVLTLGRRLRLRRRVLGAIAGVVVAALLIPAAYWRVVVPTASPFAGERTAIVRYQLWGAGLRMWLAEPVRGVGVGQFGRHLPAYSSASLAKSVTGELTEMNPHDLYVALLAETGVVGLSLLMWVAVRSLRRLRLATGGSPAEKAIAGTWASVLVVLFLTGVSTDLRVEKLLWVALGAALSLAPATGTLRHGAQLRE